MSFLEEDESMQMLDGQRFHECEALIEKGISNIFCKICSIKLHPLHPLVTYHRSQKYKNIRFSKETLVSLQFMNLKQGINRIFMPQPKHNQIRHAIVNYIKSLSAKLCYSQETLHLAIAIMDLVLAEYVMQDQQIMLISIITLMISAKMNEPNYKIPLIENIVQKLDNKFMIDDFIQYEILIIKKVLNYSIDIQTTYKFVQRYLYHGVLNNDEIGIDILNRDLSSQLVEFFQQIVDTLTELTLNHYQLYQYNASTVASAIIMLAKKLFGTIEIWNQHLSDLTQENDNVVYKCAQKLENLLKNDVDYKNEFRKIQQQKHQFQRKIKQFLISKKLLLSSKNNELFNCSIAQLLNKVQEMQEHQKNSTSVTLTIEGSNLLHSEKDSEKDNSQGGILFKKP